MSLRNDFTVSIRKLARQTIDSIRAKQHWWTDQSRIEALYEFERFLNSYPNRPTVDDIVSEAKKQIFYVSMTGGFGFRGKKGSNFLFEMNNFLDAVKKQEQTLQKQEAELRVAAELRKQEELKKAEQERKKTIDKSMDVFRGLREKRREIQEQKQRVTEDWISFEMKKHHPNSHMQSSWKSYVHDLRNSNGTFLPRAISFEFHTRITPLHADVQRALTAYKALVTNKYYAQYLHDKSARLSRMDSERLRAAAHAEIRAETRTTRATVAGITENPDFTEEIEDEQTRIARAATTRRRV